MIHQITKRYNSHLGLDLKSSDLNRDVRFASAMRNAQYRKSGAIEKRKGWQVHTKENDGFGLFNYKYVDENNTFQELVVSVGRNLEKLLYTNLSVSYTGAEAAAYLTFYFDPVSAQYRCHIIAGLTEVLDFPVGVGIDEASPVTVEDLRAEIDALTDFTATVTGDGTVPAAFLKIIRDFDVKQNTWVGVAGYWSQVLSPVTDAFDGSYNNRNAVDFENVSAVNINNVIYFSNGYDYLYKFDGQNLYRAGMPKPATLTSALGGAGAITGSNYYHRAQYVQVDNVGNIIEGNILAVTTPLTAAAQQINVTVANILAASGFNTNAAIVNGLQAGVTTITVDNGSGGAHTLQIGDTAYFFDGVSSSYVERKVTNRTSSSITIAGAAVNVADNAVISNNLRISIQRNKTSAITPTVFYTVAEIPNNPFAATQVFADNLADASLGALIDPPATDRSLPPKGKYITSFQNLLFVTGIPENPNLVAWSDIDSPEYFPVDTNQDKVESSQGDVITGIAPNGPVLAIMKENSTHVGSGTFGDNNYRFEEKAAGIGCSSHASLTQVEGVLCWWSDGGPYRMSGGQLPQAIGMTKEGESRISPVTDQPGFANNPSLQPLFFRQKRIIGINWIAETKLLFYIPAESVNISDRYPNLNSRVYAYDYSRDAWLEWDNLNMIAGSVLYKDEFYFKSRRLDSTNTVVSELQRMHNLNDSFDYQDNLTPVLFDYAPQWEDLGQPAVLKKFLEVQVYSLEEVQNNDFNIVIKQEMNYQAGAVQAEFMLTLTGSGYGQSPYGVDPYGDPSNPNFKHDLARTRTRSTRTRFTNETAQQNCIISGWEYLIAAPFRPEFKR